jgi:hypothetical protein
VTFRTGHMGYTFRFFWAGGVDAVESELPHQVVLVRIYAIAEWGREHGHLKTFRTGLDGQVAHAA